jgi:3-oxoacyl-[acyl-carrier protein] reductase
MFMDFGLANKTALVLGGGGLGRAIAVTLAREGEQVAIRGNRRAGRRGDAQ